MVREELTDCLSFFECGRVGGKSGRDNVTVVGLDQGEYEVVGLEFRLRRPGVAASLGD